MFCQGHEFQREGRPQDLSSHPSLSTYGHMADDAPALSPGCLLDGTKEHPGQDCLRFRRPSVLICPGRSWFMPDCSGAIIHRAPFPFTAKSILVLMLN